MRSSTIKRIIIAMLLGILLAAVTTEVSYQVRKRENREPSLRLTGLLLIKSDRLTTRIKP